MRYRRDGVDSGGTVVIPAGFIPFFAASAGAAGARKDSFFAWLSIVNEINE